MKRTLLAASKAVYTAWATGRSSAMDEAMPRLGEALEAERLSSIERARASIFRRMTPEQRERARERAVRTLAALASEPTDDVLSS